MSTMLYIQASPRGARSHSTAVADAFIETYKEKHAGTEIVTLNLFDADLPAFDGPALDAKYKIMHGQELSEEEKTAWTAIEKVIAEFKAADLYVLAVPMWNFGVPYRLKHYVDVVTQPGLTFSFTPEQGYKGLVTGKPAVAVYARGGEYPADSEFDLQKKYVETFLGFVGFTDIRSVLVEPTLMGGPETVKDKHNAAIADARELAGSL